jgi:hypothetical protein
LFFAFEGYLEQSIVASGRTENLAYLLGVHGKRYGGIFSAVKRRWDFTRYALAASLIFAAGFAGCCFDYDLVCHCLVPFL